MAKALQRKPPFRCMKTYSEGTRLDLKDEGEKIYIVLEYKEHSKPDPPCGKKTFS